MKKAGKKEIVESIAMKKGISLAQAEEMFDTVMGTVVEAVKENGFVLQGMFTIEPRVRKGRTGTINGVTYNSKDKISLAISTGKVLDRELNN